MILDIAFSLILIAGFHFIGSATLLLTKQKVSASSITLVLGYSVTICIFLWYGKSANKLVLMLPILMLLIRAATDEPARLIETKTAFQLKSKAIISMCILVLSYLQNPSLMGNTIVIRRGPDFFGWYTASRFFSGNENLHTFENRIKDQLDAENANQLFDTAKNSLTSVFRLNSFNDQIAAEFLLGAHRIGIPSFIGTLSKFSQVDIERIMHAIVLASAIITLKVLLDHFQNFTVLTSLILCSAFLFNANTISVYLEGGFGQFLSIPIIAAFISSFLNSKRTLSEKKIILVATFMFCLSSYFDLLTLLMIGTLIYSIFLMITSMHNLKNVKNQLSFLFMPLLISALTAAPNLNAFVQSVIQRFSQGTSAGWDQGNLPFLSDFLGLTIWLSPNGVANPVRGLGMILVTAFTTVVAFILLTNNKEHKTKILGFTLLGIYISLLFYTYALENEIINNYVLYKFSGYATLVAIFVYFHSLDWKKSPTLFYKKLAKLVHLFLITMLFTTSTIWIHQFQKTSIIVKSDNNNNLNRIMKTYDVEVIGFANTSGVKFLLDGPVNYFASSRGFEIPVDRTNSIKPLVFIISKNSCKNFECLKKIAPNLHSNSRIILETSDYTIWKNNE